MMQGLFPVMQQKPTWKAQTPSVTEDIDFERPCTCKRPRVEQSWTKAVGGGTFRSALIQRHRRRCVLFREKDEITELTFDMSLVSRLVNTAARLSLSLQYGAGGMSVSPSLTFRGMTQPNSPVFALIKSVSSLEYIYFSKKVSRMEEILPKIQLLVQSGQASLHDVDEHGRTVFDVRCDSSLLRYSAYSFAGT